MFLKWFCFPAIVGLVFFSISLSVFPQVSNVPLNVPSNADLFPETTQGFFEVTSVEAFKNQWNMTRLGALLKAPVMQSARDEVQKQIDSNWVNRLGLSLDDLQTLPTGLISGGMIAIPGTTPGFVLVISVKGQTNETLEFMQRIGKKLEDQGVKKATTPIENVTATYFTFEKTEKNPQGGMLVYLLAKDSLVITDRQHLATIMVKRLNGDLTKPLRNKPAYKAVMERVTRDALANNTQPLLKWYIEPLEFTAAMRMISGDNVPKKKGLVQIDAYKLLATHGFKSILGIGGILDLATDNNQLAYRIKIYAPQPHEGAALKMLSFKNGTDFSPPIWLPDDSARFTVLYANPQTIFANIGPIFDDIVDEPGVWEAVLDGFRNDPYRQKIDIEKELVDVLGDRLELMTRFEKPISPDSSRFVAALVLKPGKDAEAIKAFDKLFSGGQDAKRIERNGYIYWQSQPDTATTRPVQGSARTTGSSPPIAPRTGNSGTRPTTSAVPAPASGDTQKTDTVARDLFFDKGGLVVGKGRIFISNNLDDLYAVLDAKTDTSFDVSKDFLDLTQKLGTSNSGQGELFMQILARSDELTMPTYELIRDGKMPEAQTILGAILRAIAAPKEGQRSDNTVEFNRATLPPFEQIRSYFGTAGTIGTVETDGWFIEGIQMP